MFIRRLDTLLIHHTTTWRSKVPHTTLPHPVHIIRKWEECIARARHPVQLARPRLPLLLSQRRRNSLKLCFPLRLLTAFEDLPAHEQVDRVRLLGTLDAMFEREREDTRVVPEPP